METDSANKNLVDICSTLHTCACMMVDIPLSPDYIPIYLDFETTHSGWSASSSDVITDVATLSTVSPHVTLNQFTEVQADA